MVKVSLTSDAAADLEELHEPLHARVLRLIERLENWPNVSGAKPLSGKLAGYWRMRTGDYRLQFRVEGERVIIEKLGHRDRFYED